MQHSRLQVVIICSILLAGIVIGLGAYTRLTGAGLGCPDWPGCYGHMVLPKDKAALDATQTLYPTSKIQAPKAWTEMTHRYVAGTLGLFVFIIGFFVLKAKALSLKTKFIAAITVLLVIFQALLGMWTVTLKLLPLVVMGHLMGGISIIALLWWLYLRLKPHEYFARGHFKGITFYQYGALIILFILFCQIALGGWTSANYAALSCVGFPSCNGMWVPPLDFASAFSLSPVGPDYSGGLLDSVPRMTIQFVHRVGALVTTILVSLMAIGVLRKKGHKLNMLPIVILIVLALQIVLGIINVTKYLPLHNALSHNIVAVVLLLAWISLTHRLFKSPTYE